VVTFFVRLSKNLYVWIWLPSAKWLRTTTVEVKKNVNYHILLSSQNYQTESVVV